MNRIGLHIQYKPFSTIEAYEKPRDKQNAITMARMMEDYF